MLSFRLSTCSSGNTFSAFYARDGPDVENTAYFLATGSIADTNHSGTASGGERSLYKPLLFSKGCHDLIFLFPQAVNAGDFVRMQMQQLYETGKMWYN